VEDIDEPNNSVNPVVPAKRGVGIGQAAALAIFEMFPGHWELQVHRKNYEAIGFWEKCIKLKAKREPTVSRIIAADGSRIKYSFEASKRRFEDAISKDGEDGAQGVFVLFRNHDLRPAGGREGIYSNHSCRNRFGS
jgi:hypothetical protein